MVDKLFFELIQISLGNKKEFERLPSNEEWQVLYDMACKQSLESILLDGVNKCKEINPTLNIEKILLLEWIGVGLQTESQNKLQNAGAKQLTERLKKNGFRSCVLKGQGTALYYDRPEHRQCGDIDIWVTDGSGFKVQGSVDDVRSKILLFAKEKGYHVGHVDIKHSDIDFFEDVPVEVHFLPSWMYLPSTNKRLLHFFNEKADKQFSNYDEALGFAHTTIDFDLVFSIVHIYRHIFSEGIGLRQLVDYYYILKRSSFEQRKDAFSVLKEFRMKQFVGGIMWILKNQLRMDEQLMLCPANEKHGKFLLSEIMTAGNFGHYDYRRKERGNNGKFSYGLIQLKKNLRFVSYYPTEVMWSPIWKTWHYFWRKRKGYL